MKIDKDNYTESLNKDFEDYIKLIEDMKEISLHFLLYLREKNCSKNECEKIKNENKILEVKVEQLNASNATLTSRLSSLSDSETKIQELRSNIQELEGERQNRESIG